MEAYNLSDMVKGWFVGGFTPTVHQTEDVEVAVKHYRAGDNEVAHYHKIATEITVVVEGRIRMNGVYYVKGDMIKLEPGEATDFWAISDSITVVVKHPGAKDDKWLVG